MFLSVLCSLTIILHNNALCFARRSGNIFWSFQTDNDKSFPWSYEGENGPETWHKNYPMCAGLAQSPVYIDRCHAIKGELPRIHFNDYHLARSDMKLENNGHTVQVFLSENDKDIPYIEGGGLSTRYNFQKLQFHWGKSDKEGAEHILNEEFRGSLELQLVHTNTDEAKNNRVGIAILAVIFQAKLNDVAFNNTALNPITNALKDIMYKGSNTNLQQKITLSSLFPKGKQGIAYYRYNGSLTTPPCTEGVIWTVYEKFAYIGTEQVKSFRQLFHTKENDPKPQQMAANFRPEQNLYGRSVFFD